MKKTYFFQDTTKRWLCAFALLCGVTAELSADVAPQASQQTSLEDLRKEFEARFAAQENRIASLEKDLARAQAVDGLTDAIQRVEVASVKAEVAAQKAEEAYSSTIAASQIGALAKDGNNTGWRDLSDYTKGFEFHGMLRTTFGVNGDGGPLVSFIAPGAGGFYTFGNRDDTYGELRFVNHFLQDDLKKEGVRFKAETLIAYATNRAFADGSKKTDKFSARQVFVEAEGIMKSNPSTKLWVGQRYYLNYGFPINNADIMNYGGYGAGIMDHPVGNDLGKLSLAYIGGTVDVLTADGQVSDKPSYAKNNLVVSLDDVDLPGGKGLFFAALAGAKGRSDPYRTIVNGDVIRVNRYKSTSGIGLGAIHTATDFFGGFNQAAVTFGYGAGSNLSAVVDDPVAQVNKSWSCMLSDTFVIQPRQNISVAFVASAQFGRRGDVTYNKAKNVGTAELPIYEATGANMKRFKWFSLGVQPVYHFNKYVDIALEGAVDWVGSKLNGYGTGALFKGTVALELSPDWSFTAKPVCRLFFTAATWAKGLKGMVGGDAYKQNRGGYTIGASVDASW